MEGRYASWDFYKSTFKGYIIPTAEDFDIVIGRAESFIDDITQNRAISFFENTPLPIQKASCAVAEEYFRDKKTEDRLQSQLDRGPGILVQESVDGFQQTYAKLLDPGSNEGQRETRRKAFVAARVYLRWTGLLYVGVDSPW